MNNIKLPPKNPSAFIAAAPDAKPKGTMVGNQKQISLAMPAELIERMDSAAQALNLSRASYIKMIVSQALEREGK